MRAVMGDTLRCPVCGRPHHALVLRSGDAWLTCWHRSCGEIAWAVRVPAVQPIARDIDLAVGVGLAASLLATYAPAPLVVIGVPAAVASGLRQASRVAVVQRLSSVLIGEGPPKPAVGPRSTAA